MNNFICKFACFLGLIFFNISPAFSQTSDINYSVSLGAGVSSEETLPFWLVSNRYGNIPNSDYGLLNMAVFSNLKKENKDFGIAYKLSATGALAQENSLIINEMYLRLQYKNWALDGGNMYDEVKWEGLSSSNGNIVKSINSRAYPGINLKTLDYISFPFAKKWLSFQGNFANYWLNDDRYVEGAMLQNASLYFKFKLSNKFNLIAGMDHFAQWGGTSPSTGEQPSTFKDFMRIVLGKSGGATSTEGDQLNALGNHLGDYLFQVNYTAEKTNLSFYYSHLFEDRSGMEMENWMDGLYGFMIDFKKSDALVTHLLTEFTYTKNMSGEIPPDDTVNDPTTIHGRGRDNYFNNGIYASGWTYFGRTIGSPYFTPKPADENGITNGVILGDNRFMAFNIGLKGNLTAFNYKAMLSHITYFGWFGNEYDPKPKQVSVLLEVLLPQNSKKLPFNISAAFAFDTGTYAPANFGGFLTLSRNGWF
jgi:hypothetical protein